MKTTATKSLAMAFLLAMALGALAVVSGCANEAATSASADSDAEQPSATTQADGEDSSGATVPGSSMSDTLTLSSDTYQNLGWKGTLEARIESAQLYKNYDAAKKEVAGLLPAKDAITDGPVLACEVFLDNSGAVSQDQSGAFKADFMFLGPDRIPVTFFALSDKSDVASRSDDASMEFELPDKGSTTITVGFSVPQTWLDGSVDINNRDYIAFGGTKEQYHMSYAGEVPDNDFIWLTTEVFQEAK